MPKSPKLRRTVNDRNKIEVLELRKDNMALQNDWNHCPSKEMSNIYQDRSTDLNEEIIRDSNFSKGNDLLFTM
jgi:hypothetical protein